MQEGSQQADNGDRARNASLLRAANLPLLTVRLQQYHDIESFKCPQNLDIESFARDRAREYVSKSLGEIYVLESKTDRSRVEAFYTFSCSSIRVDQTSHLVDPEIPSFPVIIIGYLGRDINSRKGVGAALVVDAAKRGYRLGALSWGLTLYAANGKLVSFYSKLGFNPAKSSVKKLQKFSASGIDDGNYYMYAHYDQLLVRYENIYHAHPLYKRVRWGALLVWMKNEILKKVGVL